MHKYAQITESGNLIGLSQLAGEVKSDLLIPVSDEEYNNLRSLFYQPKFEGGRWVEGLTPEEIEAIKNPVITPDPKDERISQLEQNQLIMQETINFLLGI